MLARTPPDNISHEGTKHHNNKGNFFSLLSLLSLLLLSLCKMMLLNLCYSLWEMFSKICWPEPHQITSAMKVPNITTTKETF